MVKLTLDLGWVDQVRERLRVRKPRCDEWLRQGMFKAFRLCALPSVSGDTPLDAARCNADRDADREMADSRQRASVLRVVPTTYH